MLKLYDYYSIKLRKMSEYHFIAYSEYNNNSSSNALTIPIDLYKTIKKQSKPDELSTDLNVPYTVFEILVAIFAIVGNSMVIIVFQQERKLRRRTNYYIVSLAIADFLVGFLGVPFAILASVGLPTNLHACLFTVSLLVVLCTISIFCLLAVSIDRYWAILHPMAYSRNVRTKTAIGIISMCWIAGGIVGFLPLFGWHAGVDENQACLFVKVMDYNYLVFLYFATIITPALLLLAFYAHIYRVIIKQVRQIVTMKPMGDSSRRSSMSQIQLSPNRPTGGTMLRVLGAARKREVKATQNLSIIVLFFMICWIPLYTINCVKAFCPDCFVHPKLTFFCIILSHLNSAVNPVLYAYHLKDFRAALKNLILRTFGVEVDTRQDLHYRISLASQQRFQSLLENRNSLRNRLYVDSPIWLRQQRQMTPGQRHDVAISSTASSSLNNTNQTAATAIVATPNPNDGTREMWKISEAASASEDNSRYNRDDTGEQISTEILQTDKVYSHNFSFDNKDFSSSLNDLGDDEIFLSFDDAAICEQSLPTPKNYLREKLKSDTDQYEAMSKGFSITDNMTDSDEMLSFPRHNSFYIDSKNEHRKRNDNLRYSGSYNDSIFIVENDRNPLSPEHNNTRLRKSSRLMSPLGYNNKKTNTITRSCSCSNDSQLININNNNNNYTVVSNRIISTNNQANYSHSSTDKLTRFNAVGNMVLPPDKHSSLFHIFDHRNDNNSNLSLGKKRTLSHN